MVVPWDALFCKVVLHLKDVQALPEMLLSGKAFLARLYKALGFTSSTENQTPRYVNVAF